jgi:hypothetical protein
LSSVFDWHRQTGFDYLYRASSIEGIEVISLQSLSWFLIVQFMNITKKQIAKTITYFYLQQCDLGTLFKRKLY